MGKTSRVSTLRRPTWYIIRHVVRVFTYEAMFVVFLSTNNWPSVLYSLPMFHINWLDWFQFGHLWLLSWSNLSTIIVAMGPSPVRNHIWLTHNISVAWSFHLGRMMRLCLQRSVIDVNVLRRFLLPMTWILYLLSNKLRSKGGAWEFLTLIDEACPRTIRGKIAIISWSSY